MQQENIKSIHDFMDALKHPNFKSKETLPHEWHPGSHSHPEFNQAYNQFKDILNNHAFDYLQDIPSKYKRSLKFYSGLEGSEINRSIVSDNIERRYADHISNMDNALNGYRLPFNATIYRYFKHPSTNNKMKYGFSDEFPWEPDKKYSYPAFLSHTLVHPEPMSAQGWHILRMRVPKGSHVLPIQPISNLPYEEEVLVPRNANFHVTSVQDRNVDPNKVSKIVTAFLLNHK